MKHPLSLRSVAVLTLVALTFLSASASAQHRRDRGSDPMQNGFAPSTSARARISMEEAIAQVQKSTGGRVLDARDVGDAYRLKVLRDGEVRIIFVDAQTGKMR